MKITYFQHFAPSVSVHEITDDFGNELQMCNFIRYVSRGNTPFTSAKLFVTGMTFEEAHMLTNVGPHVEH